MQSFDPSDIISSLDRELHELAQPVSSIQCRLEIARIVDNEIALREAVDGGLDDLRRLTEIFKRMRALIAEASKGRA